MMDVAQLWDEVVRMVRKHGIPRYVAAWPYSLPGNEQPKDVQEIRRRLRMYHSHTSLQQKHLELKGGPVRRPIDAARADRELRRPPEFAYDDATGIGTVTLYTLVGLGLDDAAYVRVKQAHATAIHDRLDAWERAGLKGLLIDLRKHHGGTMWPHLRALGRFFEGGVPCLAWVDDAQVPGARKRAWLTLADLDRRKMREDRLEGPGLAAVAVRHDPSKDAEVPLALDIPVAVVIGPQTSSAGEFVAAAFAKKRRVRTFGSSPTSGALSANMTHTLAAAAGAYELVLTVSFTVLTDGTIQEHLDPDVLSQRPMTTALAWLRSGGWPNAKSRRPKRDGACRRHEQGQKEVKQA